jgi:hypothetical protein
MPARTPKVLKGFFDVRTASPMPVFFIDEEKRWRDFSSKVQKGSRGSRGSRFKVQEVQ